MSKRNLIPVWIGIILLSCMFLMGAESWETPEPPVDPTPQIEEYMDSLSLEMIISFEEEQDAIDQQDESDGRFCNGGHLINFRDNAVNHIQGFVNTSRQYVELINQTTSNNKQATKTLFQSYKATQLSYMETSIDDHACPGMETAIEYVLTQLSDLVDMIYDLALLEIDALSAPPNIDPIPLIADYMDILYLQMVVSFEEEEEAINNIHSQDGVICDGEHRIDFKDSAANHIQGFVNTSLQYVELINQTTSINKQATKTLFQSHKSIQLAYMETAFDDHICTTVGIGMEPHLTELMDEMDAIYDLALLEIDAL